MINFLSQLLDLIYKKRCYVCGSSRDNAKLCSKCMEKIHFLPPKILKQIYGVNVYSTSIYEKGFKKTIRGLKYHKQKELAFFLAKIMYKYWQRLGVSNEVYSIVPVPLYENRQKKRGYNHMELVAYEFSKLTGYKVNTEIIERIKDTKPQYKLSKRQRERNLHNAFRYNENHYNNEKLLLIDDILTTGSTMEEMIKTFHNAGIKDLTVFVSTCTGL